MVAMGPLVHRRAVFALLFITLLFNPMSYTERVMTATLRKGIYPALTLLVIGCTIGFLIRHVQPLSKLIPWLTGLGLSLSAFWLTREEGVWIMPFILFVIGLAFLKIFTTKPINWGRIFFFAFPFAVWLIPLGAVAGMNKIHYGIFATSECRSPDFLAAYGALCRVKHAHWQPTVPVPKETRERIYLVSPAFAELKPFLEPDMEKRSGDAISRKIFLDRYEKDPELRETINVYLRLYLGKDSRDSWVQKWYSGAWLTDEVCGGDFLWPLRDAVATSGYHSSGISASKYYRRLAAEINAACSDGRLACSAERATMMSPWHDEYTVPLIRTFFSSIGFLVRFENFSPQSKPSVGPEESLAFSRKITQDRLLPPEVYIAGWAFTPEAPISLSVSSENGKPWKAVATLDKESDDVYRYFLSKGIDIPNASHSRFEMTTYCTAGCYLDIKSSDFLIKRLPLDGSTRSVNTPKLCVQIDNFEYENASPQQVKASAIKTRILESIGKAYQFIMPILGAAGLILYIIVTLRLLTKATLSIPWIINTGLLIAILSRSFVVSLIHVSSFPAISTRYLSPVYGIFLIFVSMALYTDLWTSHKKATHNSS